MKKSYSDQLKDPRWQKKRLEIMQRDNFACQLCGDKETMLNVHHKKYTAKDVWDEPNENLTTLCEHCHHEISSLSKEKFFSPFYSLDDINLYKSNNWQNDSRIMFVKYKNVLSMNIYNKNSECIIGFNFTDIEELNAISFLIDTILM